MFIPLLIVLRNSVCFLNPLLLTYSLIIFSSMPGSMSIFIFHIFAGIIVLNSKSFADKHLPLEIVKPFSRKKLFLSEYLSYYFSLLILLLLFRLGGSLRHHNCLYRWLESRLKGGMPGHESVLVAGSFFLIAFLALSIRQAYSLRNSFLFFYLGFALVLGLAYLSKIIGLLPILATFSILTVLFLIIAFRLDCQKDI